MPPKIAARPLPDSFSGNAAVMRAGARATPAQDALRLDRSADARHSRPGAPLALTPASTHEAEAHSVRGRELAHPVPAHPSTAGLRRPMLSQLLATLRDVDADLFLTDDAEGFGVSGQRGLSKRGVQQLVTSLTLEMAEHPSRATIQLISGFFTQLLCKGRRGDVVYLTAGRLTALLEQLATLHGLPHKDLMKALNHITLRDPASETRGAVEAKTIAPGNNAVRIAGSQIRAELDADDKARRSRNATQLVLSGLWMSAGGADAVQRYDSVQDRPLPPQELGETWGRVREGAPQAGPACARVFEALSRDATLGQPTLLGLNVLLKQLSTETPDGALVGIETAITALAVHLPDALLGQMVVPAAVVDHLSLVRDSVLCQSQRMASNGRYPAYDQAVREGRFDDIPALLVARAREVEQMPAGRVIAQRFNHAIAILERNAIRLDRLMASTDFLDDRNLGKSLGALLDEFVPAETVILQAPTSGVFAQPARAAVTVHLQTAASTEPPHAPKYPAAKPGAQPRQPGVHHHPKDHRALTKEEVRLRQDKYKLVLAGMLNPYAKLTPELRDQLVGLNRQLNWQPGQRLIRVDYLAM